MSRGCACAPCRLWNFPFGAGRTTRYPDARTDRLRTRPSCPPTRRRRIGVLSPQPASLSNGSRSGGPMLPASPAPGAVRERLPAAVRAAIPAVLLALLVSAAHAQTFFVDAQSGACSNAGPGTELQPYCTISAAIAAHKGPGITIVVKPGVYREQVTVPASGAAGRPFVIQAQGPGVVIDGSDDFAGTALWTPAPGAAFVAAGVTWMPKQLYVDGARLTATTAAPDAMPPG